MKKVALVACMDARLIPTRVLGLFTDDDFRSRLQNETGIRPEWAAEAFSDVDEDVRQCIRRIDASPFIPRKNVRGFVYDVATGTLREVEAQRRAELVPRTAAAPTGSQSPTGMVANKTHPTPRPGAQEVPILCRSVR